MSDGSFPDALILAALRRAELHRRYSEGPGESYPAAVEHLGLPMSPATGRKLRPRFRELEASGLIAPTRRHSLNYYVRTAAGERVLADAGEISLPESPQHRAWREAREAAEARIQDFYCELGALLAQGVSLFARDDVTAEEWFALGEQLAAAAERVGSAKHCICEWVEPSDDAPDVSDGPRRGSRNPRAWDRGR